MSIQEKIENLKNEAKVDIANYAKLLKKEQLKNIQLFSKKRIYRSSIFCNKLLEIEQAYQIQVEKRKEKLKQDIQKLQQSENLPEDDVNIPDLPFPDNYIPPYPVDMTLSLQERYYALCEHYKSYPTKEAALAEIDNDIFIQEYLGFYYTYLRQYVIVKLP